MANSFQLGEKCEIKSSKRIFAKEYVERGVPFWRSKDVIDKALGEFSHHELFISNDRFNEINDKFGSPKNGDLLISSVGNRAGQPYLVRDEGDFYFKDGNILWLSNFDGMNPSFLAYWLKSSVGQKTLSSVMIGSAQKAITIDSLRKLSVDFPNEKYQAKAVELLEELDSKIEVNRQTNQTLEQMAQTLFKSWFVDFDPVFDNALASGMAVNDFPEALQKKAEQRIQVQQQIANGELDAKPLPEDILQLFPNEFEQTEDLLIGVDGWVPKDWKLKTIDELNDINPESWTKKNAPDTVKYVDLANAKNGTVLEAVDYSFSEAPSRARRILNKHDIIIGVVRPANRSFAYVNEHGLTGSTGFAVVRAKKESYRAFSYLSLTNDECITEFARIADGAAYPAIKPDDVAKAICLYSNEDILKTFENIVGDFLSKKAASEQQLKPLASLRDTLLPKLISGELSIPTAKDCA